MEPRTMAGIGVALWLAAAPLALAAAQGAKPGAKPAPGADATKDAQPGADAQGVKAAGPHLVMAPHPGKNPGRNRDHGLEPAPSRRPAID